MQESETGILSVSCHFPGGTDPAKGSTRYVQRLRQVYLIPRGFCTVSEFGRHLTEDQFLIVHVTLAWQSCSCIAFAV